MGRNNRVSVSEGDTLDLGEYRLRVGLEKVAAKISPFAEAAPWSLRRWPMPVPSGAPWSPHPKPPMALTYSPAGAGAGGDPFYDPSMDPFAAKDPFGLGGAKPADPFASPADPFANPADPFANPGDPFANPADPFAKMTAARWDNPFAADPFWRRRHVWWP